MGPELFACLSIYENAETLSPTSLNEDSNLVEGRTRDIQRHEMYVPPPFLSRSFQVQENAFILYQIYVTL